MYEGSCLKHWESKLWKYFDNKPGEVFNEDFMIAPSMRGVYDEGVVNAVLYSS